MPDQGFRDLLRRARDGDRPAMDQLLAAVLPDLRRYAARFATVAHADASASDLVQQTTLQAWQKLGQFQSTGDDDQALAQFRAWTRQILHSLGLNDLRHRSAQRRRPEGKVIPLSPVSPGDSSGSPDAGGLVAADASPSSNVRAAEESARLRLALTRVPDDDRVIMQLRFFDWLSLRQIADRLNLNQDKVRQRYHLTLRRLERELGDPT